MQLLSYWVDVRLGGFSTGLAYGHQILSFLLSLLMLYLVLARELRDAVAALVLGAIWALLPSTAVVLQFLATRHYLEGFLFAASAFYLAGRPRSTRGRDSLVLAGVAVCSAASMLYKEIYAATVPLLLAACAWRRRDPALAFTAAALSSGYFAYRLWALGPSLRYADVPLLTGLQYVRFLSKFPYTVSSNYGGYVLAASGAVLAARVLRRDRAGAATLACLAAMLLASLACIFPVSYPIYGTIRRPDPWYRVAFLPDAVVVLSIGYMAVQTLGRRSQAILALLAFAVVLPGTQKTRSLWVQMTASAAREGRFYLANPDKTLLSEQEAWWFIPGVHWMYGVSTPHYVLLRDLPRAEIAPGSKLWRYRGGGS